MSNELLQKSLDDVQEASRLRGELRELEAKVSEMNLGEIDISEHEAKVSQLTNERLGVLADISIGTKTPEDLQSVESRLADARTELSKQQTLKDNRKDLIAGLQKRVTEKTREVMQKEKEAKESRLAYVKEEAERVAFEYIAKAKETLEYLVLLRELMKECNPNAILSTRYPQFPMYMGVLKAFKNANADFEPLYLKLHL